MEVDLEDFNEQINELLTSIRSVLDKDIPKLKGQERIEKCHYLRNRLTRAKQVLRSINVEIKSLSAVDSPDWESKAKRYEEQISKLTQDIEWAENTTSQGTNKTEAVSNKKNIDEMTTGEITKQGLSVQQKTQESTGRAQKALQETIEIGMSTNAELKKQGEKIKEIEEGLDQVETNLKRADKQIRIFIRRLSSDKIFMLMILLMVLAIIGIIIVVVLKKNCPPAVQGMQMPKFVPIPVLGNPDTNVEVMAINYFNEYEKAQNDLQAYLDAKKDRERRKQEAFNKKLVPEKTSTSDLSAGLQNAAKKPDLSEFDTINNNSDISASPSKVDFSILKEIMGLKDIALNSIQTASSNLPAPKPITSFYNKLTQAPVSQSAAAGSATSVSSSLVSMGSFHQRTNSDASSPPKIQTPSPSKREYISKLPELTQTRESLLSMGFFERNVEIALSLYQTDKDLLDFLFLVQEFPFSFLERHLWRAEITVIPDLVAKIHSLSEMGFTIPKVLEALSQSNLSKDGALEVLLRG